MHDTFFSVAGDRDQVCISLKFSERIGLTSDSGCFRDSEYPGSATLTFLNDSGTNFLRIADVIERHARARFIERYHPKRALKRFFQKRIYGASSDSLSDFVKE